MITMNFDMELLFTTSGYYTLILMSDCPFKHDFIWFWWNVQLWNGECLLEETWKREMSVVWKRNLAKAEQRFFLSTGITLYNWGIWLHYFLMLFPHHAALCLVCVDCSTRSKVDDCGEGKIDTFIFLYVFCFKWSFWTLTWNNSSPFQSPTLSFWYQITLLSVISFGSARLFNCEMMNDSWKKRQMENCQCSENEIWQRENRDFSFRLE